MGQPVHKRLPRSRGHLDGSLLWTRVKAGKPLRGPCPSSLCKRKSSPKEGQPGAIHAGVRDQTHHRKPPIPPHPPSACTPRLHGPMVLLESNRWGN